MRPEPTNNGAADLLVRILGWCGDPDLPPNAIWPPPYPPPTGRGQDPDGVGWCVKRFGISRSGYEQVVELAEELLESPEFQEAVSLVSRALCAAPELDRESLELLRQETGFADELEEAA